MIYLIFGIVALYCWLIVIFTIGAKNIPEFKEIQTNNSTNFSIVIPFRNEAAHLPILIDSLLKADYPSSQFELLFINDESDDDSVEIIENRLSTSSINYSILNNQHQSNSPKKDAIQTAIAQAKFEWIITTDADCSVPVKWLQNFDAMIQQEASVMIVAPVSYPKPNSFLEGFQLLDNLSLQGSTQGGFGIGKPFLCNGANLAYQKEAFINLNGFQGNNHIASGDDIFLLEKFVLQFPDRVKYLKTTTATVTTTFENSWSAVIQQRIRWAAKSSQYHLKFPKWVGILVFTTNLTLVFGIVISGLEQYSSVFILKILADYLLISQTARFFKQKLSITHFVLSSLLYPFLNTYVALKSTVSNYRWKGREFIR